MAIWKQFKKFLSASFLSSTGKKKRKRKPAKKVRKKIRKKVKKKTKKKSKPKRVKRVPAKVRKKKVAKKTKKKLKSKSKSANQNGSYVGRVTHFFPKVKAAVVKIEKLELIRGETIRIRGETTHFKQKVTSLEIDRKPIDMAVIGDEIGLGVKKRVREGDKVFKPG